MPRHFYFVTHPDVVINPKVPVTMWPLSDVGRARMRSGLSQPWTQAITSIYCSTEQKAIDGAEILGNHLSLPVRQLAALGENDRSATGYLPPTQFEKVADEFFASPEQSVLGWERAVDAQARICNAVSALALSDETHGAIAIVSHGAVGALLYCKLSGVPISRQWDQPPTRGGNYFSFALNPVAVFSGWRAYDGVQP